MYSLDDVSRNPDGSYKYAGWSSEIAEVERRRGLGSENVPAEWETPADVTELLGRVYPDGAPEAWTRFFTGEKVEDTDIEKIRAALKPHAQRPPDSGLLGDERLLRASARPPFTDLAVTHRSPMRSVTGPSPTAGPKPCGR